MKKIVFVIVIVILLSAVVAQASGKVWWNPTTWFASVVIAPEPFVTDNQNNTEIKIQQETSTDTLIPKPDPKPILLPQKTSFEVIGRLGETLSMFGGKGTITELIEDSRCPKDVQCIWAGTVKVKIHVVYGIISKDIVLTLNETYTVQGYSATLTKVFPEEPNTQTSKIPYVFTFILKSPK